nr:unnamed protein product [Callosobruchus analis]
MFLWATKLIYSRHI